MTDYAAEQEMEMEALEAILMDEMTSRPWQLFVRDCSFIASCIYAIRSAQLTRSVQRRSISQYVFWTHAGCFAVLDGDPPARWPAGSVCYRIAIRLDEEVAEGEYESEPYTFDPCITITLGSDNHIDEDWRKCSQVKILLGGLIGEINGSFLLWSRQLKGCLDLVV